MRGDDSEDDWDRNDLDDWDGEDEDADPDVDSEDDDGETVVLPCPSCGTEVYEDAERCPHCGEYIVRRLRNWEGKPWWWVALGLLGIGAVIWALGWGG